MSLPSSRDMSPVLSVPMLLALNCRSDGIKKLRSVEADQGGSQRADKRAVDLWRGMRNLKTADDFLEQGGSEAALMSTTSELEVAIGYSLSPHSLVLKIRTDSFLQRGASISFLSAFPGESEFLYPPLVRKLLICVPSPV